MREERIEKDPMIGGKLGGRRGKGLVLEAGLVDGALLGGLVLLAQVMDKVSDPQKQEEAKADCDKRNEEPLERPRSHHSFDFFTSARDDWLFFKTKG